MPIIPNWIRDNKRLGGYGRAKQVHDRWRKHPPRREKLLRAAAKAAKVEIIYFEKEIYDENNRSYWYDIQGTLEYQTVFIDLPPVLPGRRDRAITKEKHALMKHIGYSYLAIKDDTSQAAMQAEIEIFKIQLRGRR